MAEISSQPKRATTGSLRDSLNLSIDILTKVKTIIDSNSGNLPSEAHSEINKQLTDLINHLSSYDKSKEAIQTRPITAQELREKNLRNNKER